jgi:peptidoglycan/xylan/chitin deacetylase (PgdA/CDA1 family)
LSAGILFVPPGSRVRRFAEALAWLWRLGPVLDSPVAGAVGLGSIEDAEELHRRLRAGDLAGAAVFATRPGPEEGPMPSRQRLVGVASFGPGCRVSGQFSVLHGGKPLLRSSLGVHAVRDGGWMVFGADPETSWGALDGFWVLPALADFLTDLLERPLIMLPPIGWARYDDVPGTAYHQVTDRDHSDAKVRRRVEKVTELFKRSGSSLNVAVVPRAFADVGEVAADTVWPRAFEAIERGVEEQVIEPLLHGYLHLDTDAWASGQVSPREFAQVDRDEAGRRLDVGIDWFRQRFGSRPNTFVAPTWAYSEGLISALSERELPAWLPPRPAPLVEGDNGRETLFSTLEGLFRLDYGPFRALAHAGMPPTVVVHGGLFDSRTASLRKLREAPTTIRLIAARDLFRAPWVPEVRWIGAGELLRRYRGHARVEVDGDRIENPGGFDVVVRDRSGSRLVGG